MAVKDQGSCRFFALVRRRRKERYYRMKQLIHTQTALGTDLEAFMRLYSKNRFHLFAYHLGLRCRKVDFIEHRNNLQIRLDRKVSICHCLGLNTLSCIHNQ